MKRVPLMAGYERDAGGEALLKDLDITEDEIANGISKSRLESMIEVFAKKRNKQYVLFHEDRYIYKYSRMIMTLFFNQFHDMMNPTRS